MVNEIFGLVTGNFIHYSKLKDKDWSSSIVKEGAHLFTYKSLIEGLTEEPQKDVDESKIYTLEDQSNLRKENFDYYSQTDGFLVKYNQSIKFISINYDGFCNLKISEDKDFVTANMYPPEKNGEPLSENFVVNQLRELKVTAKIEIPILKKAVAIVNSKKKTINNVLIAKGKAPVQGVEGWVEYLFDVNHKIAAVVDENGHTDFHNRHLLESVSANQTVAILHPTVQGKDGENVFGEKIPVPKVREQKAPRGQNIIHSEENPNNILSKIDGHISLTGGNIVVTDLYNIRGDIDFNTGHVVSKGSLVVTGNVVAGFNLDMSQSIKINGHVHDSEIVAGGDVTIQGGFSGTGEGKIVAGGNLCARFIRNQTVYCRGTITIEKEVVDAKLFAKDDITSKNNDTVIIGGHLMAGGDIIVNTLGHDYTVPTILEVGYDYEVVDRIKKIEAALISFKKELESLKSQFTEHMSKNFLMDYQTKTKNYQALLKKRKELREEIGKTSNSKVTVSGGVYPGVKIIINGRKLEINEEMHSKIFMYSAEEDKVIFIDK